MRVFESFNEAKGKIKNAVVTTGSFDGVHIGHKEIIKHLNDLSKQINGESVLITFYPHPRKVLYPEENDLKLINSKSEKIELLKKAGLNNLIIVPFTLDFSKTTSHDFIVKYLLGNLNTKIIVIGHNYQFGHKRQGDNTYLHDLAQKMNFRVEEIPLKGIKNETISSTKIRKILHKGNIQQANNYLGHQFFISGIIKQTEKLPGVNDINMFELIIEEPDKLIPPPGIYAIKINYKGSYMKGMAIIYYTDKNQFKIGINLLFNDFKEDNVPGALYFYKKIKIGNIFSYTTSPDKELMLARNEIEEAEY